MCMEELTKDQVLSTVRDPFLTTYAGILLRPGYNLRCDAFVGEWRRVPHPTKCEIMAHAMLMLSQSPASSVFVGSGQLPCFHSFHHKCIAKWFTTKIGNGHDGCCPTCNQVVVVAVLSQDDREVRDSRSIRSELGQTHPLSAHHHPEGLPPPHSLAKRHHQSHILDVSPRSFVNK